VVGIWSVIVCNKQGLILRTNEAMQKLTGFAKEKLLTENWNDYFSLEGENLAQ
jgi:PAS domain S-box-containing protein